MKYTENRKLLISAKLIQNESTKYIEYIYIKQTPKNVFLSQMAEQNSFTARILPYSQNVSIYQLLCVSHFK